MNNFHTLTFEQKQLILRSAEEHIHLPAVAIEKDMWVTCILQILFSIDLQAHISSCVAGLARRLSTNVRNNDIWRQIAVRPTHSAYS